MIANILCSFVGTIAFSVLFNVQKKYYLGCGLAGMLGWLVYCLMIQWMTPSMSSFFGTVAVVLCSRILAVYMKCPITVFLVSGIFPLVPGAGVYYTAYYIVENNMVLAAEKGLSSLKIAFAIVLGITFVVSIPKRYFQMDYWINRGKLKKLTAGMDKKKDA